MTIACPEAELRIAREQLGQLGDAFVADDQAGKHDPDLHAGQSTIRP